MLVKTKKSEQARTTLLEAAKTILRNKGFSGLSTRDVAVAAEMPLSQIHYHFGSKEGMVLALFDFLNEQLLSRQAEMFGNPDLRLSEQWKLACDYLDEDLASGYVTVLQELWVAGYSNPEIAAVVRRGILGWQELLTRLVTKSRAGFGPLGDLPPQQIAALIGAVFIGGEAYILLGLEKKAVPIRKALRAVGDLIDALETTPTMR
jgi:AcrR family transcriptional regulator